MASPYLYPNLNVDFPILRGYPSHVVVVYGLNIPFTQPVYTTHVPQGLNTAHFMQQQQIATDSRCRCVVPLARMNDLGDRHGNYQVHCEQLRVLG